MSSNEPVKNGCEVIYEMFHILKYCWCVKIYSDTSENCSIPGIYGGLLKRDFSFDS